MLISAPLTTRYLKISSQRPFLAAMCRGVNWWRKRNYKSDWPTSRQISVHADFTNLWFLLKWVIYAQIVNVGPFFGCLRINTANSKLKPVILHSNLLSLWSLTYPTIVFAVHISPIINKEFDCVPLKFSNCNVQGCPLIQRLNRYMQYCSMWFRNIIF